VFEGAGFKTKNLTIPDPYGHIYPVCTTMQWDFKSSQNSVTLTVETPKTDTTVSEPASPEDDVTVTQTLESTTVTIPPTKTPEQLQQEMESSEQIVTKPRFSWCNPWFWLETTICHPALGFSLVACTSLFDGWLGNYHGLENPLHKIFEGVTPQQMDTLTAAAVASITTAVAAFIGGYITMLLASGSVFGPFLVQALYLAGGLGIIFAIAMLRDAYISRAILITTGWTLLSLATLGFARILPTILAGITGGDVVATALRTIINALLGMTIAAAILKALKVNMYHFIFYAANFLLGMFALGLGHKRM
jgi:hypothetical protein